MGAGGLFFRKLRAKVADEPTGFVWVEEGRLAGSGYPASKPQVEWLMSQGIDTILTLTRDPLPKESVSGVKVELGHIPLNDHAPPDVPSMEKGAEFIRSHLAGGRKVVVHCLAGEGRTGCILAAYLMKERGIGAEESLKVLRGIKPEFVEWAQEGALKDFESSLR